MGTCFSVINHGSFFGSQVNLGLVDAYCIVTTVKVGGVDDTVGLFFGLVGSFHPMRRASLML